MSFVQFYGIGAQKAGTTWLYENLKRHPQINFPPMKEVHYWDMFEENGLDWYKALFPAENNKINGEITPAYAILPPEKIQQISKLLPDLKLIFIHRNQVDRAFSAALMELSRAGIEFEKATDEWFIENFNSEASRKRGDYETCLKNWLQFYPQNQLLLIDYREISTNPQALLIKTAKFLNVDSGFYQQINPDLLKEKIFSGAKKNLKQTLKKYLEGLYSNQAIGFQKFLAENKFNQNK